MNYQKSKYSLIFKIISLLLIQAFLLIDIAFAGGGNLLNYKDQLKTTLAPRVVINNNSFILGGILEVDSIADTVIMDINSGESIMEAVLNAYKSLYLNINKGAKYNVRALRLMIEQRAKAEEQWTSTRRNKVIKTLWRVHLENMLIFDEIKNIELGETSESDKIFIKEILLNPDYLNNSLKRILKKEIKIGDITKISSNRFEQGYYKNIYLVIIELNVAGKKEKLDFILKVTKPGAIEEAIGKNNEDVEWRDVSNFVSSVTAAADMLNLFGIHPESGLYFIFSKKRGNDIIDYRGVIIEQKKKGRTPKQIESILRAKIKDQIIDLEEFNQQRINLYRQCIATYVLGYVILDGQSISDMFPNNIVLEETGGKNKIYFPQMVDLDELGSRTKGEFIGDLIDIFSGDDKQAFIRVAFDAILDVYGKKQGKEFLEDALRSLDNPNLLSYELRFSTEKEKIELWKKSLGQYLKQEINDYQQVKWDNIEAVRAIAFLPTLVKAVILKAFKGQSLNGNYLLQKNILKIVNEKIRVILSEDIRDFRINIREQAIKKRAVALAEIEGKLTDMRQEQKAYRYKLLQLFNRKNAIANKEVLDIRTFPSFFEMPILSDKIESSHTADLIFEKAI
ncbi:MAG: hypothetical protein KJ915_06710 [Candidatus Omnitrophica bacterium]|nr:hypothetical protein [Candidatus Omnitrophota bacterium]